LSLAAGLVAPASLAAAAENPDARGFLTNDAGAVIACCALWWNATPVLDGMRVGAIGGFAALDAAGAKGLLDAAVRVLWERGCETVVGPMNGNTWRHYRFVVGGGERPPFLLEPRNPLEYPEWWQQAGFAVLSRYTSSVILLGEAAAVRREVGERLVKSGVTIRSLDPARYDEELRAIHGLSLRSFSNNFLYTPLDEEAFLESYRKVRDWVDPDFVMLAERAGRICGYLFGIADLEAAARGGRSAVIAKTLAVDPAMRGAGLGAFLIDELHRAARGKGYDESIHALQHASNSSLRITGRHKGRVFRHYALFSKRL
jgi:GNAT superfamily N-acetyltransferase